MKHIRKSTVAFLITSSLFAAACAVETRQESDVNDVSSDADQTGASYLSHIQDQAAAEAARKMMDTIGGPERWADLASMHISAVHTQPDLEEPYTSNVWRNVGQQQVRLVQEGTDFRDEHIYLDGRGWTIRNGEVADMHPNTVDFIRNWNRNLVYAVLKDIGTGEDTLSVSLTESGDLNVYRDGDLAMVFGLDASGRYETFSTPSSDGETLSLSRVRVWGETDGYIHPVESETDMGAVFTATSWEASTKRITIDPPAEN